MVVEDKAKESSQKTCLLGLRGKKEQRGKGIARECVGEHQKRSSIDDIIMEEKELEEARKEK